LTSHIVTVDRATAESRTLEGPSANETLTCAQYQNRAFISPKDKITVETQFQYAVLQTNVQAKDDHAVDATPATVVVELAGN